MLKKRKRQLLALVVPGLLLILMFVFIPLINGLRVAFFTWNGYSATMKFVGIQNFIHLFSDNRLLRTTINTLIYGFGNCLLQNILGLSAALFINRKFRGRNLMRAIIYMPVIISMFIMGRIQNYMFSYDNGVFNDIIALLGCEPIYWLQNGWAGVVIITVVNSILHCGSCMLIYLAGLQNVPKTYIEAAAIDGATPRQSFLKVTLPTLIPSITTCVVTSLIGGMKLYEIVIGLTDGGPNRSSMSLSQYIQLLYFEDEKAGYAAAVGLFMFFLIMVLAMPVNKYLRSKEIQM